MGELLLFWSSAGFLRNVGMIVLSSCSMDDDDDDVVVVIVM